VRPPPQFASAPRHAVVAAYVFIGASACGGLSTALGGADASLEHDTRHDATGPAETGVADVPPDIARVVESGGDSGSVIDDGSATGCTLEAGSDGGCGDVMTGPQNCGTCGHDCAGGACQAGSCVPLPPAVLVSGQASPAISIATDGASVYWLNQGPFSGPGGKAGGHFVNGQVMKCAIGGCKNNPIVLASGWTQFGATVPSALVLDETNVYWAGSGLVISCSLGGCACKPTVLTMDATDATGVTVSAGFAFWTEYDVGQVMSCPSAGCSGSPTTMASGQVGPMGMTADEAYFYWTNYNGALMRCSLPTCTGGPTMLWRAAPGSLDAQTVGIAVDATNLYWTNGQPGPDGSVLQCAKASCESTVTRLASKRSAPWAIAVDATSVYWTEEGGVYKCAIGGCGGSPSQLASSAGRAIAVDAANVYFSQQDTALGWEIAVIPK
jgi:hypothetical protein